jgi:arsenate reductase (thioredoxin)
MRSNDMTTKLNVIFVCSGNSCRSQMAEGWAKHLHTDRFRAFSAGTNPRQRVDPLAIQVMKEAGIDIARQETHAVEAFLAQDIDVAITVCDDAAESCPTFPAGVRMIHRPFDDPPRLAEGRTDAESLEIYRRVRDDIRTYVERLPALI